ncbi:hypothetical protein C8J56DRAFT_1121187 [Mycena floridula]|nr:hypothetical protein C8J56DRAFT_1121187 [Mycena floridula]
MPKAPAFVPKPALEKLPLAVRKDLRDNFEADKKNQIVCWLCLLRVYLTRYTKGFIDALKHLNTKFGEKGKALFNRACTQSELTVTVNTLGVKAPYVLAEFLDGVFRILFKNDYLGSNASSLYDCILPAIDNVPTEAFSLRAEHSIDKHFHVEIDELKEKLVDILAMPNLVLDPNFEEVYQALLVGKKEEKDWRNSFGLGFKGDDMLQEGLVEVASTSTFKVRVVPKLVKRYCNEVVIEDGIVYLQTTVDKWSYNISSMGEGLIDLL